MYASKSRTLPKSIIDERVCETISMEPKDPNTMIHLSDVTVLTI